MEESPKENKKDWSAPESSVIGEPPLPDQNLEPLQPLETDLGSAMSRLLETQQPEVVGQPVGQPVLTPTPVTFPRRIARMPTQVCPQGLAGSCVICPQCPCSYLKARVLRAMVVELEMGKPLKE